MLLLYKFLFKPGWFYNCYVLMLKPIILLTEFISSNLFLFFTYVLFSTLRPFIKKWVIYFILSSLECYLFLSLPQLPSYECQQYFD